MLQHGRPDGSGESVAGCADRNRYAAVPREPQRDGGDERCKAGDAADTDEQVLRQHEDREAQRVADGEIAEDEHHRPGGERKGDAEAVGEPRHTEGAARKAEPIAGNATTTGAR